MQAGIIDQLRAFQSCRTKNLLPASSCLARQPFHFHTGQTCYKRPPIRGLCNAEHEDQATRQGVETLVLPIPESSQQLNKECQLLAVQIQAWLDEQWTEMDVHGQIGSAAAEAYKKARRNGEHEIGDVLIYIVNELLQSKVEFGESFVDSFEVANKVAEVVMTLEGGEVGCQSAEELHRIQRVAQDQEPQH